MRAKRLHVLKRPKIRQSWNKFNLYNLWTQKSAFLASRTFFQQKWLAKSISRAYHGEQVREKQWQLRFTSKIRSVVPMNYKYLAAFDGSEQAKGRGSGRDVPNQVKPLPSTPYMQMTYAPLERRLDTAIFRALFASSTRQARQFVIHGAVKVNGKKMIYPGYLLNPGDMFQVEPERVMFATGAPKDAQERRATRRTRKKAKEVKEMAPEVNENGKESAVEESSEPEPEPKPKPLAIADAEVEEVDIDSKRKSLKVDLQGILGKAKLILADKDKPGGPSAKSKQALRSFTSSVRNAIGQVNRKSTESLENTVSSLDDELTTLLSSLSISKSSESIDEDPKVLSSLDLVNENPEVSSSSAPTADSFITAEDSKALREALKEARDNPIDPAKPYATPWRPRPYMSAFAFIPRYLEVNQNICAAVYLRHPVARPGLAEVPTPFADNVNQLAFTWYLRRR